MSTVLVTGAGSGLGAGIATAAAHAGWRVGVLDRDGAAAERIAATIGADAVTLTADTTDPASIERALDQFGAHFDSPSPDAVVCNAGVVRFGPLLDMGLDDWTSAVQVNLTGTFVTARAAAQRMVRSGRGGAMVAITSINGVAPGPGAGAYGATKAGIARLSQQMALEWAEHGIRVNAVAPGLLDVGMSTAVNSDQEVRRRRERRVPAGRLGTTDDVAAAVLFLLSEAAGYITGVELIVDGGVTMSVIDSLPRPHAAGPTVESSRDSEP